MHAQPVHNCTRAKRHDLKEEIVTPMKSLKLPVLELGLLGGLLGSPKLLLSTASDEGSYSRRYSKEHHLQISDYFNSRT